MTVMFRRLFMGAVRPILYEEVARAWCRSDAACRVDRVEL